MVEARRQGREEAQTRLQGIRHRRQVASHNLENADYTRKWQALVVFDVKVTLHPVGCTPRYVITMDPVIEPEPFIVKSSTRGGSIPGRWSDRSGEVR